MTALLSCYMTIIIELLLLLLLRIMKGSTDNKQLISRAEQLDEIQYSTRLLHHHYPILQHGTDRKGI